MNDSTKIEMVETDDDVELINERQDLLSKGKKVVKSKSAKVNCCKAIIITIAVVIFICIIIQIWEDYGAYLETHSLPPAIHSMSSHCMKPLEEKCMTKNYNSPVCTFTSSNTSSYVDVQCTTSRPNNHMVQTNVDHLVLNMSWDKTLDIKLSNKPDKCLHLTIWSI